MHLQKITNQCRNGGKQLNSKDLDFGESKLGNINCSGNTCLMMETRRLEQVFSGFISQCLVLHFKWSMDRRISEVEIEANHSHPMESFTTSVSSDNRTICISQQSIPQRYPFKLLRFVPQTIGIRLRKKEIHSQASSRLRTDVPRRHGSKLIILFAVPKRYASTKWFSYSLCVDRTFRSILQWKIPRNFDSNLTNARN